MKITIILILTFFSLSCFGQQLQFNGQLVDRVAIRSNLSAYQFDDNGTTKGKVDFISYTYSSSEKHYLVDEFYRDKYTRSIKADTLNLVTKTYNAKLGKYIDFQKIKSLLVSLSSDNRSLFSQIDTNELKDFLTDKQIKKIAKRHGVDWLFKRRYSSKEENNIFFKQCKSIDTLKLYLSERFDTSGYILTFDYTNTINVTVVTNQMEYKFEGRYPNAIKQPWHNLSDSSQDFVPSILNLEINRSLYSLLPSGFLLKESISNEALVNDYITWFFERNEYIY